MPRWSSHNKYNPEQFQSLLQELLRGTGESYRQASKAARLDVSAVSRYMRGTHPSRDACIALADHFAINPNEMLKAAGYKTMAIFDEQSLDPSQVRPKFQELEAKFLKITNLRARRALIEAMHHIVDSYLASE